VDTSLDGIHEYFDRTQAIFEVEIASERNFSSSICYSTLLESHKNKQHSQNSLRCRNKCNILQKALFMQDDALPAYTELLNK
jgi:hypothetical protein